MSETVYATCVVAVAFLIFGVMFMTTDQACHNWIGPWMTRGDSAAVFVFCEGN